jgi:hypothetical protein
MEQITQLIGRESGLDDVARKLYEFARAQGTPVVGALHLTCADEAEIECAEAFQHSFTDHLLPSLKFGERASFRLANLGARYEWGAVGVADDHYSTRAASEAFKLMVIKVNSHVCVDRTDRGLRFGRMSRYDIESTFCGALHHMLGGGRLPFADHLREAFSSEGLDRVALLNDAATVNPEHRSGFAALVNARIQARRVAFDIRERHPITPTLCVVVPCVTLNRPQKDTEVVCGVYRIDWRGSDVEADYTGLGDDPSAYRLITDQGPVRVEDDNVGTIRRARDHRGLVLELWLRAQGVTPGEGDSPLALIPSLADAVRGEAVEATGEAGEPAAALKRRLTTLARHDPVPSAILLFALGLAGAHHLFRAHRLARGAAGEQAARAIIGEVHDEVDRFTAEEAAQALQQLSG